jgi:hypothetical protein
MQHFLFILMTLFLLVAARPAVAADSGCLSGCAREGQVCQKTYGKDPFCVSRMNVCLERCDPQQKDRRTVLMMNPNTVGRLVTEPRHRLDSQTQRTLCEQDCATNVHMCRSSGNGDLCDHASQACRKRCATVVY